MTARPFVVFMALVAVAGCGVTPDDSPRKIDPPRGPFQSVASPTTADPTGLVTQTLFLVKDEKLVPVVRHLDTTPTLNDLVEVLIAGPTDSERAQGITSALLGNAVISDVRARGYLVIVELSATVDGAPRTDEVLAYAQLVCTLTTRREVTGITFTRDGKTVGVPRGDGSLSSGPLTAADYASSAGRIAFDGGWKAIRP
jgi:hypothetical protein